MSPDPFDELDRALSSGLSALAPDVDGSDDVLASVRPRYARARRRARLAKAGGVIAVFVTLGSIAAIAAPRSNRPHVSVTSPSSTPGATRLPGGSTSTTVAHPSTTTISVPGRGMSVTTSPSKHSDSSIPSQHSTPTSVRPAVVPSTGPGTPSGSRATTTTAPSGASDLHAYDSQGGSVSVRFTNAQLTLVHIAAASGYRVEVHDNRPDRVEVRFTNDAGEWRIEVQVDRGQLTHAVTHH